MTALKEYDRLEATALWRPARDEQRREVVLSLGDLTLLITDLQDRVLAHWSLPGMRRVNPGRTPAIFHPRGNPGETLEIDAGTMVEALDRILGQIDRESPHPGRLRRLLLTGTAVVAAVFAFGVLPGLLRNHALRIVPAATVNATGERLLTRIRKSTGATCANPAGVAVLGQLSHALLGDTGAPRRLLVVSEAVPAILSLPGGITLINRDLIEAQDNPDILTGYLLADHVGQSEMPPMQALLEDAGLLATLRLLSTGNLPDSVLEQHARTLLSSPRSWPGPAPLAAEFSARQVPLAPFVQALGRAAPEGYATLSDSATAAPLLPDADWLRLQTICDT